MSNRVTTRRRAMRWLGAASAAMLVAVTTGAAFAVPRLGQKPTVDAELELVLLHGTKAPKDSIPDGYDELKNPPWNAFNHYVILENTPKKLALTKGTAVKEALPDGSTLETTLIDTTPKYQIKVELKDGKGNSLSKGTYKAGKGARFLPVQAPYKGGGLVVSLKIL